jgi:Lon protease-like protein
MLPGEIPIFPLPNVVLFPDVFLPLHIFEPRYRAMTREALDGNRLIGMVLERGTDDCFDVGCAGVITHVEELDGERYNIILRGLQRFRIIDKDPPSGERHRMARIESLLEGAVDKAALRDDRARLEALLATSGSANFSFRLPPSMPDAEFVHALSQYFGLEAIERQALLEMSDAGARCRALIELVEMQLLMGAQDWRGKAN